MDIDTLIDTGHLPRGFDVEQRIPDDTFNRILAFLRSTPSSVSVQPWRALVLKAPAAQRRLVESIGAGFQGNATKLLSASHVLVLATLTELSDDTLQLRFSAEEADGRFPDAEQNAAWQDMVRAFITMRRGIDDVAHWMEKQTYLAAGMTAIAAKSMGVDAALLEGFDRDSVTAAFNLDGTGYQPTLLVALGYRDDTHRPPAAKSRLAHDELFTVVD